MFQENKGKKMQCSLVFYIGSAFVEAQIVDFNSSHKAKILFNTKNIIKINKEFKPEKFLKEANDCLKKTCEDLIQASWFQKDEINIEDIQLVFSFPWYSVKAEKISFANKKPFTVSRKKIEEAIEQTVEEFLEENEAKKQKDIMENELLMERKCLQTSLNGYSVEKLKDKKATLLGADIFLSILSKKAHDEFTKTLFEFFNEREVYFHSLTLSLFTSIRDEFSEKGRFAILNMEGEITEIIFVSDGVIKKVSSFPIGYNSMIRDVAEKEEKSTIREIQSQINLYVKNELEEKEAEKISKKLEGVKDVWTSRLSEKIEDFSKDFLVPNDFYILSPDNFLNWSASIAKNEELYKYTILEKPFKTYKLAQSKFVDFISSASSQTPSVYIQTATLYLKKYKYF